MQNIFASKKESILDRYGLQNSDRDTQMKAWLGTTSPESKLKTWVSASNTESKLKDWVSTDTKETKLQQWVATEPQQLQTWLSGKTESKKSDVSKEVSPKINTTSSSTAQAIPKTQIEIISNIVTSNDTTESKIEKIINIVKVKGDTREQAMAKALSAIWKNTKPLIYLTVASIVVATLFAVANVYLAAGSWMLLLNILKNLGMKVAPAILVKALQSAGISVASNVSMNFIFGLAEKNKKVANILNTQIKPQLLINTFRTFGVDISRTDLSVKSLTRQAISNSITLATGDVSSFLISASISGSIKGASLVSGGVKSGLTTTVETLAGVKNKVMEKVFSSTSTDTLQISREILQTTAKDLPNTTKKKVNVKQEQASSIVQMINENKAIAMATTTAITLTSIALAGDLSAISELIGERLGDVASAVGTNPIINQAAMGTVNFIKENATARAALFGVLSEKIGMQKLIDIFVDKLTPAQTKRLTAIAAKPKDPTVIQEFFAILLGEKIYSKTEIEKADFAKLSSIAKSKNIKFQNGVPIAALRDAIFKDQTSRMNNITYMVAGTLTGALKTSLAAASLEYGYQNLPFSTLTLPEIETEISKIEPETSSPLSGDAPPEVENKVETDPAKIEEAWNKQMEDAQNLLAKQRSQRKLERAESNAQRQAETQRKKEEKIELTRLTAASREAARRLREAVQMEDLARKANIVITGPEGVSHPIPVDDLLLDPKLQEAMSEIEFTPLMQYLGLQTAKASTSWIPGIGWINSALNTVNWTVDVAEKVKDIYKVVNVAVQLTDSEGKSSIDIGEQNTKTLDYLLKQRLPTIGQAIEDLITLEKVNLKQVTLEALRDKILYGWNDQQVAYEIGKKILLGKKGGDIAESVIQQVGEMIWKASS